MTRPYIRGESAERDRQVDTWREKQRTRESTLRAIRALEKAADEIMRAGDPRIAVEAYSAALRLRMEANVREEEPSNATS